MSESNPASERPDANQSDGENPNETPMRRAIKKGSGLGALAGVALAKYIMEAQSIETPVGPIYTGNILLMFAIWVGVGAVAGAGIGWLSQQKFDDDDRTPPPDFAREP